MSLFYTTHYFPSIVMASSFPLITHVANLHKIQVFIGIRKSDHMMFKKQHFIIKLLSFKQCLYITYSFLCWTWFCIKFNKRFPVLFHLSSYVHVPSLTTNFDKQFLMSLNIFLLKCCILLFLSVKSTSYIFFLVFSWKIQLAVWLFLFLIRHDKLLPSA